MIINVANFNFGGDGGGGGKPALLQEKTATIVQNGSQTITPDEGFDGMSSVQINAAITGDSSAIDFSSIGYDVEFSSEVNAKMNNDVAYSKTLYDAWNPSNTSATNLYSFNKKIVYAPKIDTRNVKWMNSMFYKCSNLKTVPLYNTSNVYDMNNMFIGCTSIQTVPLFDTSNVDSMANMFLDCSNLTSVPLFDTSKVDTMTSMFRNCSSLTTVPPFDTSNLTKMNDMFSYCKSLTTIPDFNTIKVNNFNQMLSGCESLTTIEGISFKSFSASTMSDSYIVGYSSNSSIRKAVFKDIGYQSTAVQFNTESIRNWGVNTDDITDARQSLIDSLITYSFDRASAGYPTCEIKLYSTTKSLLTSDEIAQIEAKGFVIA